MAIYLLFNKGVAYTFGVEILLACGLMLIILNRKQFEIFKETKYVLILSLCFITLFYILLGFFKYNYFNVIRDSFAFEYALFAIIIFYFKDQKDFIWQKLIKLYKWAPLILLINTHSRSSPEWPVSCEFAEATQPSHPDCADSRFE